MSGFYGIYRYDGAPVDPDWLDRMRAAMAYYGPDGSGCTVEGPVGMGHLLLQLNPEDAFENQPVRGERGLVVTAARLDNRDALLETFNIRAADAPQCSDGQLISLAFDRWGEEICSHLEGDWALAAWDKKQRRLLLARDILGTGALYYHQGKGFTAFASSLKALLAIPGITKEPDLERLVEVLASWHANVELTSYKNLRSVVSAHAMTVTASGQMLDRSYWSYDVREPLRYRRDEEYVEAFLEHYTRAVKSCLRTQKTVAAELSGGRDSGSVVALAAPILASQGRDLTTYTSVPLFPPDGASKDRLGNEWDLAQATATMAGANVRPIPIDAKDYGVIQGLEYFLDVRDGPGHAAGNYYWGQAIMESCATNGAGAILNGGMGNLTVSWSGQGSALLSLVRGDPATAFRLFFQADANPWTTLKRQILKPLLTPSRRFFRRLRTPSHSPWRSYSALNVHMAERLDLDARMRTEGHDPTFTPSPLEDGRKPHFWPGRGMSAGGFSDVTAWHSVSCLAPTANFSLLEFILRVPDDQFYRKGQSSFLIQRAFQNCLPEAVLSGRQRGLQSADLGHRIVRELPVIQECLRSFESVPEVREMLDLPLLHRCLEELTTKVNPETHDRAGLILIRGIGVGLFLRRLANANS